MSLKENLKNKITSYKTLNEIYQIAREEQWYKEATIERRLRELTEASILEPKSQNGYIIGYKPKNALELNFKRLKAIERMDNKQLNGELKEILLNIKPSWEISDQIKEIQNAIKSKYPSTKINIIQKYVYKNDITTKKEKIN